ncbi:unnamed protein product, partial [Brassica rapa subsp. trilocularis]
SYPSDRQASTGGDYRNLPYRTRLNGAEVSSCTLESGLWCSGAERCHVCGLSRPRFTRLG